MNKDQIKGKVKMMAGTVEEQAGYWTDDKKVEAKGIILQAEGKIQKSWGDVKDAVGNTMEKIKSNKEASTSGAKKNKRKPV